MSLISADFFYNIHRRFVEILHLTDMFADRAVMLVGDLLQIPPVCNQQHGMFLSNIFLNASKLELNLKCYFLFSCFYGAR